MLCGLCSVCAFFFAMFVDVFAVCACFFLLLYVLCVRFVQLWMDSCVVVVRFARFVVLLCHRCGGCAGVVLSFC